MRLHIPDTIPAAVDLAPFVDHLRVPPGAGRIDRKLVAVSSIVKSVENEFEIIPFVRVEIFLQIADDQTLRLGILRANSKVDVLVVVEHPNFSGFGGCFTFPRFGLKKIVGERCGCPGALLEASINSDCVSRSNGSQCSAQVGSLVVNLVSRPKARQEQQQRKIMHSNPLGTNLNRQPYSVRKDSSGSRFTTLRIGARFAMTTARMRKIAVIPNSLESVGLTL